MHERSETGGSPLDDVLAQDLASYGQPFAKALAVFVQEMRAAQRRSASQAASATPAPPRVSSLVSAAELAESQDLDDVFPVSLAQRIRMAMASRGMNAVQLAEATGVSTSTISRLLQNPEKTRLTTLRKIAGVLGIPLPR